MQQEGAPEKTLGLPHPGTDRSAAGWMTQGEWFRKEKARERSHLTPMEECSELAGRVEPLAVLRGSIPHMSLDASCQSGHI